MEPNKASKKIVVVGAGFAGLNAAKSLSKDKNCFVTIIDRRNYHLFQPLLYQVATAGLSPAEIAAPIRGILSAKKNVRVLLGNVNSVNLREKIVNYDTGQIEYDYLILACGAKHSYFGHSEWEDQAPGLKTLEQATEIRRRILLAFEMAEKEPDFKIQKEWLTFVIVGAGPTGVELAGAIGEISKYTLEKDFSSIDPSQTNILIVEAGDRILPSFSEKLAAKASRDLEALGVKIRTQTRVTQITPGCVFFGSESISAKTVLWAAGVQPASVGKTLGVELDASGRVIVERDLSLREYPEVFVLGDQAHAKDENGKPLPGLAPVAIQEGRHAAKNIKNKIAGLATRPFHYFDKGQMATIGRTKAIVQMKHFEFSGFWAWITWLFIHVLYLIGFKNRVFVLLEWAWSYLSFKKGARLIVDKEWRSIPTEPVK